MSDTDLYVPLAEGDLALEPLAERHRVGLRAACAQDAEIWEIYPFSYAGDNFDPQFDALLRSQPVRRPYAIHHAGTVVGMTAWIEHGAPGWSIEIGNTYIAPSMRGTGFNDRLKRLMLDHAFACGLERVGFKVDVLNTRSQAAVRKIGGVQEGVLRRERRTWTGRVRDTVQFSILRSEWEARQS
ncbi:GNAT family N-acetyltransferase [Novosphingobium sp. FKTRR1]|uniref:GNAT family N-acetyltransferase n=1 Tax=Novosphingobium sp. FKTRR1 TaxID=2879118 RepID=UPI001CEFEF3E|nr:GNAT family protein [Novosphingobium sp. FKTRR1]